MPVILDSMSHKFNVPEATLRFASEELDNQLQNDRQYSDLGAQIGLAVGANGRPKMLSEFNIGRSTDFDFMMTFFLNPVLYVKYFKSKLLQINERGRLFGINRRIISIVDS